MMGPSEWIAVVGSVIGLATVLGGGALVVARQLASLKEKIEALCASFEKHERNQDQLWEHVRSLERKVAVLEASRRGQRSIDDSVN